MNEAGTRWVMVNCTGETLTEAGSGGIAAWILGVVRSAAAVGATVPVVTKRHAHLPVAWTNAIELDYPSRSFRGAGRTDAYIRRLWQYVHPWQPLWNRRVITALKSVAPEPCNILFHNDPELATITAEALPQHQIWHLLHNTNPTGARWKRRFRRGVRPLAVSDFIARWWEAQLGAPSGSVETVYAGVDSKLFAPATKSPVPLISYAGLLNQGKAPDLLLAACELLTSDEPASCFSVTVIGAKHYGPDEEDPYTFDLHRSADRLAQKGISVSFPGFLSRSDLASALGQSSINVVPSRCEEAFGLAVLESMASGAATVASNRGGLPEAVGDAGVIIPTDDARSLADTLRWLLDDPGARRDLAVRGRMRAIDMSWERTWRNLTTLEAPLSFP